MAVKRITKRWLFNSFFVILVILIAVIIAFSLGIRSYYYSSVQQVVNTQANTIIALLQRYAEDPSVDFASRVRQTVENFEQRDHMELMAIDQNGAVIITSSGFSPERGTPMPDYEEAQLSYTGYASRIDMIGNEKVLAVTSLFPSVNQNLSAVRFVVSLTDVDAQIILFIVIIALIGMGTLLFVIMSSSYFINSIVTPVGEIGVLARKIAQGDFEKRLEKKNDDEIGDLCDVINYMAQELSANEKLKNDFISSISHELRTPLTAIKGWSETLSAGDLDQQTLQKGMRVITSESERLTQMVEELLDFSRIQNHRLRLIPEKLDIVAELSDVILMFSERSTRENIALCYDEPEFFFAVLGDRGRLRQVFINIIDNAFKYSDPGGSVTVSCHIQDNHVQICVADRGCGIKAEDLPYVKNKFYKSNYTRRGSGIGLAVADEITRLHGGSLELSSVEGEGTAVTITLPSFAEASGNPAFGVEEERKEGLDEQA